MLTATYSLVAISAEQDKTRNLLHRLQQFVQAAWKGVQSIDFGFLDAGYNRLTQFDHYCRNRKIEAYLIPALRGFSNEADKLIAELEVVNAKARHVLQVVGRHLAASVNMSHLQISQVYDAMQAYCRHASERLTLEEQWLLPLARRLFSVEDWFSLATQFLSGDGRSSGRQAAHAGATTRAGIPPNDLH